MAQAKTLKESEFKKVLLIISTQKHAHRNRIAFLLSFWSGMRVGEIASLKINDVMENDGAVKSEIILKPFNKLNKINKNNNNKISKDDYYEIYNAGRNAGLIEGTKLQN